MNNKFDGKVVLITGGGSGLGFAVANEVASEGAKLSLVDINEEALEQKKDELLKKYPETEIIIIEADVSDEMAVKKYVDETMNQFGRIDGFYNNAGIEGKQATVTEYDINIFKKVIDVNLYGVYYGLKHILPIMQKQKYGLVVNTASVGGILGVINQTPYVASKHAVVGMTKNAAIEYARDGITVNAIAPGAILTPMVAHAFEQINPQDPKKAELEFAQGNPTKRLGLPEEVAKLVSFLLSGEIRYINGQTIAIDGGQSILY